MRLSWLLYESRHVCSISSPVICPLSVSLTLCFPNQNVSLFFFKYSDCSLLDSGPWWKCFISLMQKWNQLHFFFQKKEYFIEYSGGWGNNNQNPARGSEEYKLQLRTKEMEINGRICRFFWQLNKQIIFWEFNLCCLCQVRITTELGNIKYSMIKKGHSITPT